MSASPLLPLQPIPPDGLQHKLCDSLLSDMPAFEAFFRRLRDDADRQLSTTFPSFSGKPYPLGRCREIRDAVYEQLVAEIQKPTTSMGRTLHQFVLKGGIGCKIWGILRESYFQNAIQLGRYYVDVSNDTVVASKPKVEILPIDQSGLVPVQDFFHFAKIARSYWECEVYANTILPGLAALFPLICVYKSGASLPAPGSDQMIALTRRRAFQPAIEFLEQTPAPPPEIQQRLRQIAGRSDAARLRLSGDALSRVRQEQAAKLFESKAFYDACIEGYRQLTQPAKEQG